MARRACNREQGERVAGLWVGNLTAAETLWPVGVCGANFRQAERGLR